MTERVFSTCEEEVVKVPDYRGKELASLGCPVRGVIGSGAYYLVAPVWALTIIDGWPFPAGFESFQLARIVRAVRRLEVAHRLPAAQAALAAVTLNGAGAIDGWVGSWEVRCSGT